MLLQSSVPLNLLQVLRDLGETIAASDFALAGGTSLALRLGHRLSVDLDFFTSGGFDPAEWAARIGAKADSITGMADGTLQLLMNGVKVEFLNHSYPKLAPYEIVGSLRMWSLEDIAAMKLNAIANRGSKKDFHDIAALLERFPLDAMVGLYQAKYQPASLMMVIRSLAWFDDAEMEPDPVSLNAMTWPMVRERMVRAIRTLT
jgi:predicted nucleotidyltransferase component of viral defense system